jgi:hypothetical protein
MARRSSSTSRSREALARHARHRDVREGHREDADLLLAQEVLDEDGPLVEDALPELGRARRLEPVLQVEIGRVLLLEPLSECLVLALPSELLVTQGLEPVLPGALLGLGLGEALVGGGEVDPQPPLSVEEGLRDPGEGARPGLVQGVAQDPRLALLRVGEGPLEVPLLACESVELQLRPDGLVVDLSGVRRQRQLRALGPVTRAHSVDDPRGLLVDAGCRLETLEVLPRGGDVGPGAGRALERLEQKLPGEGGLERRIEVGVRLHRLRCVRRDGPAEEPERLHRLAPQKVQLHEAHQVLGHVGVARAVDRDVEGEGLSVEAVGSGEIALRPPGFGQAAVDHRRVPVAFLRQGELEGQRLLEHSEGPARVALPGEGHAQDVVGLDDQVVPLPEGGNEDPERPLRARHARVVVLLLEEEGGHVVVEKADVLVCRAAGRDLQRQRFLVVGERLVVIPLAPVGVAEVDVGGGQVGLAEGLLAPQDADRLLVGLDGRVVLRETPERRPLADQRVGEPGLAGKGTGDRLGLDLEPQGLLVLALVRVGDAHADENLRSFFRPLASGRSAQREGLLEELEALPGPPRRDVDRPDLVVAARHLRVNGPQPLPSRGQGGVQLVERRLVVAPA